MLWRSANLDAITEKELQELITEDVMESKTLEYKSQLPDGKDDGKIKFLQEVTAFANTAGGYIIFGIEAPDAHPQKLTGLAIQDVDKEKLRLEQIVLRGVRPRISGIMIHAIPLTGGSWAIVVRVPRSHLAPHMVTHSEHFKFYARHAQGKHPMDVDDLRTQFLLSESLLDKIRAFRKDRLELVRSGNGSMPLLDRPVAILHAVPVDGFSRVGGVDMAVLLRVASEIADIARCSSGVPNFDGLLACGGGYGAEKVPRYVQAFRNGVIEHVDTTPFRDSNRLIPSLSFEEDLVDAAEKALGLFRSWDFEPPMFLLLTLAGVRGYTMHMDAVWPSEARAIDRDILYVPEIVVDDLGKRAAQLLRPAFDALWNACGIHGSPNYDKDGNRRKCR